MLEADAGFVDAGVPPVIVNSVFLVDYAVAMACYSDVAFVVGYIFALRTIVGCTAVFPAGCGVVVVHYCGIVIFASCGGVVEVYAGTVAVPGPNEAGVVAGSGVGGRGECLESAAASPAAAAERLPVRTMDGGSLGNRRGGSWCCGRSRERTGRRPDRCRNSSSSSEGHLEEHCRTHSTLKNTHPARWGN